jgi:hypothetical protein
MTSPSFLPLLSAFSSCAISLPSSHLRQTTRVSIVSPSSKARESTAALSSGLTFRLTAGRTLRFRLASSTRRLGAFLLLFFPSILRIETFFVDRLGDYGAGQPLPAQFHGSFDFFSAHNPFIEADFLRYFRSFYVARSYDQVRIFAPTTPLLLPSLPLPRPRLLPPFLPSPSPLSSLSDFMLTLLPSLGTPTTTSATTTAPQ